MSAIVLTPRVNGDAWSPAPGVGGARVIEELKLQARVRHLRYTSYVRSILERAACGGTPPEIADITERLERIERAVTERQDPDGRKTALRSRYLPSRVVAGHLGKHHRSFGVRISIVRTGDDATA